MKNIATALVKAQKEFAPALKDSNNPFFKSKYADLSACINAVLDALNNNGIALIQKNHDCADGVKVETILLHESGEEYSGGILHVPTAKNDPQGYGSALTYARRYSLMATCGIAPEDDDGNAAKPALKPELKSVGLEDFSEEEQQFLKNTAIEVMGLVLEGNEQQAYEISAKLDNGEKQAIWHLLDSKTRASLKKSASLTKEK
jgi:hypothetical protein